MIRIELLSAENFKQDSLDNYPRKQDVKKVYRKLSGEYILEDCVYTEDWNMEKRRSVAKDNASDSSSAKYFLTVDDFNPGAKKLYENLGYKCVGELTDFYKSGINCYLMMKRRG